MPNAVIAIVLDAAKGAVAVLVAQRLSAEPATPVAGGLASIIGHIYPVWLGFRGGKGVATAGGVFVVLTPAALGIAAAVFALAIWVTRYISVGSMAAAVTLAVTTAAMDVPAAVTVGLRDRRGDHHPPSSRQPRAADRGNRAPRRSAAVRNRRTRLERELTH